MKTLWTSAMADQTIHGCCQRNHGAECMLITPSTSWDPTSWCLSMHIQSTLASTRLYPLPPSPAAGARFCSFWHPHTIVSANATSFSFEKFQARCRERGTTHGASYHPATNGAFTQALSKSVLATESLWQPQVN